MKISWRASLDAKLALLCSSLVGLGILISAVVAQWLPWWLTALVVMAILLPLVTIISHAVAAPLLRLLEALTSSTRSFRDGDFSITISNNRTDELGALVESHNAIAQLLRDERYRINQRELLLDTVIQATPVAMLLVDNRERIAYSNVEARKFFNDGRRFEGSLLTDTLSRLDSDLSQAILAGSEGLITVDAEHETETYHVSSRFFRLNDQSHRLILVRGMTREINRQEVNTWKKVIRVISHELNNSLAPISSLAHSGRVSVQRLQQAQGGETSAEQAKPWQQLDHILETIQGRSAHLKSFIDSYAKFARLPAPRPQSVAIAGLLSHLQEQYVFSLSQDLSQSHYNFDLQQIEQVLINLLKNALEAAGQQGKISLSLEDGRDALHLRIEDNGPGMSPEVLANALLPFYSTKQEGTGLGLPLCREIIESHGGRISLHNVQPNGLLVQIYLPQ